MKTFLGVEIELYHEFSKLKCVLPYLRKINKCASGWEPKNKSFWTRWAKVENGANYAYLFQEWPDISDTTDYRKELEIFEEYDCIKFEFSKTFHEDIYLTKKDNFDEVLERLEKRHLYLNRKVGTYRLMEYSKKTNPL